MSRAQDIMTEQPVMLPVTSTTGEAVQLLQALEIRHLPIVNEQLEVVGMLSDRDLRGLVMPRTLSEDWVGELRVALEAPISGIMSSNVLTAEEETQTSEIIDMMLEHRIGALPIVNSEGTLVGIVSYLDVLRELRELESDED